MNIKSEKLCENRFREIYGFDFFQLQSKPASVQVTLKLKFQNKRPHIRQHASELIKIIIFVLLSENCTKIFKIQTLST